MGDPSTVNLFDGWRVTFQPSGAWLAVRLHPPDGPGQYGLADGLWREITARDAGDVILQMDEVAFLPSAVMGEMVRLHKRIALAGGRLRVSGLAEHPREALHSMRLDELIPVFDTLADALQ